MDALEESLVGGVVEGWDAGRAGRCDVRSGMKSGGDGTVRTEEDACEGAPNGSEWRASCAVCCVWRRGVVQCVLGGGSAHPQSAGLWNARARR